MSHETCEFSTLRNTLRAGALHRFNDLSFSDPLGSWPVAGKILSPRRFSAFITGIATAARETNADWFVDNDVGSHLIPTAILVMVGQDSAVRTPVKFSRRAVQVGRVIVPLTAPQAGELILESVLDAVVIALRPI